MLRKIILAVLLTLLVCAGLQAQTVVGTAPDCILPFNFTAAGVGNPYGNGAGCTRWTLVYKSQGFSAVSIRVDYAIDANQHPGTWTVWPSTQVVSGALPLTTTTESQITVFGFHPWVTVELVSKTGTGTISGTLQGWRTGPGGDASQYGTVNANHCGTAAMARGDSGAVTGTSDTSVIAASGSAVLKTYVYSAQVTNTGATASLITWKDGSAGTTLGHTIAPAGLGSNVVFEIPLVTSANTAFYFAAGSASTSIYVTAEGCTAP